MGLIWALLHQLNAQTHKRNMLVARRQVAKPNGCRRRCSSPPPGGGMETLRPALPRLYMTRASAYRDALKSFIQGYKEGLQQVTEGNGGPRGDSKSEPLNDGEEKTTGGSKLL
ncbi:hypothetical protein Taro_028212 [Colocasia esculenta]|uniref:Uncharacterized protein n=1 Tax=Colocasia esculenta TaxID=4460 RepID=A0A843VKE3_COLES|nr:hypothetical protein [Colocasia esculenta]